MGGGASFPMTPMTRDRIFIVTGASSGLGYEIAKWCAMMGATVIMACRSEKRTKTAIELMRQEFVKEKAKGTSGLTQSDSLALEYMHVELSSFKSVVKFTEDFKKSGRKLHVLFLNAGFGLSPYQKSEDGLEMVLQVNYLSHFLMVAKLLPIMKQSGNDCRILLMSSVAHTFGKFDKETMNYSGPQNKYSQLTSYGNSKLYQVMQMYCMARRLQSSQISVNSIHPGVVTTKFGSDRAGYEACGVAVAHCCVGKTSDRGALCSINCATNPKLAGVTGVYFDDFKRKRPSSTARNETYQEELWDQTWVFIKDFVTKEERHIMEGKDKTNQPIVDTI